MNRRWGASRLTVGFSLSVLIWFLVFSTTRYFYQGVQNASRKHEALWLDGMSKRGYKQGWSRYPSWSNPEKCRRRKCLVMICSRDDWTVSECTLS